MGELTWDYLGHKKDDKSFIEQSDWNVTLLTKINYASNLIFGSCFEVANKIKLSSALLKLLKENKFYEERQDGTRWFTNRYEIIIDDSLIPNQIVVYVDNEKTKFAKKNNSYFAITTKKDETPQKVVVLNPIEVTHTLVQKDSKEYLEALNNDELTILTDEIMSETIIVLNYSSINWNIAGENREHRVIKIPVGRPTDEEVKEYINKIAEPFIFKRDIDLGDDMFLEDKMVKNYGTDWRNMWLGELESLVTTFADKTFKGESNTKEANRIKKLIQALEIK